LGLKARLLRTTGHFGCRFEDLPTRILPYMLAQGKDLTRGKYQNSGFFFRGKIAEL
jgi:hypothetical protein